MAWICSETELLQLEQVPVKGRDCQRGLAWVDQIHPWLQATMTRRTVSWIRENEGERACIDLFDVGSRLIHFHKFQGYLSPGFPSLLGAVNVCSTK